jgi:hypothetical protein
MVRIRYMPCISYIHKKASQEEIETVYLTKEDYHSTPLRISSTCIWVARLLPESAFI